MELCVFNSPRPHLATTAAAHQCNTSSDVWDASRPRFGSKEPCISLARLILDCAQTPRLGLILEETGQSSRRGIWIALMPSSATKFGKEVRLLGWPGLGASARLSVAHCFINEWWRRWLFGWLNGWPRPRLQRQLDCLAGDVVDVDVDVEDSGSGVPREGTRASK